MAEQDELAWLTPADISMLKNISTFKDTIARARGVLPPKLNQEVLGQLTSYYETVNEKDGKYKAMRNERFANLLKDDEKLSIGRAEAISEGEEFGQKHTYYERLAAGILEMVNTLKKQQEYHNAAARNQM